MYNLNLIKPIKPSDLIRLGRKKDGGYVINRRTAEAANILLSFGISTDWSFEADWYRLKKSQGLIVAYDFSVDFNEFVSMAKSSLIKVFTSSHHLKNLLFFLHYLLTAFKWKLFFNGKKKLFFKKGIGRLTVFPFDSFKNIWEALPVVPSQNQVIIKMDVEGAEFDVLTELILYKEFISGFIVEFHDLDQKGFDFESLIKLYNENGYVITHIHPNNSTGCIPGTQMPKLLEVTMAKVSMFSSKELNAENNCNYPIMGLDFPCVKSIPEMDLIFNWELHDA